MRERRGEKRGKGANDSWARYQQAMQEQVHAHSCNVSPLPEELLVSIGYFKGDMTVYNALGHDPTTGETIPGEFMDNWDTSGASVPIPFLLLFPLLPLFTSGWYTH